MPIEFRCTSCGNLLRTPDDTAGRQARCPTCGTVMRVPVPQQPTGIAPTAPGETMPHPGGTPPVPPAAGGPAAGANPFAGSPAAGGAGTPGAPPPGGPSSSPFAVPPPPPPGAGDPSNPYQSPYTAPPTSFVTATDGELNLRTIDLGEVLNAAWRLYMQNFGWSLLAMFVAFVPMFAGGIVLAIGFGIAVAAQPDDALLFVLFAMAALVGVIVTLAYVWLYLGMIRYFLALARGGENSFAIVFSAGPYLPIVLLSAIVQSLFVLGAALACFLPAGLVVAVVGIESVAGIIVAVVGGIVMFGIWIYLAVRWSQRTYLILERGAGPVDALRTSAHITQGNRLLIFVLLLIQMFLPSAVGMIPLCIGFALQMLCLPFLEFMWIAGYLDLTGQLARRSTMAPVFAPQPPA